MKKLACIQTVKYNAPYVILLLGLDNAGKSSIASVFTKSKSSFIIILVILLKTLQKTKK